MLENFLRFKRFDPNATTQISYKTYAGMQFSTFMYSELAYLMAGYDPVKKELTSVPDVMFIAGPIFLPLYTVQYYEYAVSHDILQYRGFNGEFLGQQKGGHWGVRIDLKLTGPEQGLILSFLEAFYIWSQGEVKVTDLEKSVYKKKRDTTYKSFEFSNLSIFRRRGSKGGGPYMVPHKDPVYEALALLLTQITNDRTVSFSKKPYKTKTITKKGKTRVQGVIKHTNGYTSSPDKRAPLKNKHTLEYESFKNKNTELVAPDDYTYSRQRWHNSFVMMTREQILFDMYIETMAVSQKVDQGGMNVTEVTLLLRHFVPPDLIDKVDYIEYRTKGAKNYSESIKNSSIIKQITYKPRVAEAKNPKVLKLKEAIGADAVDIGISWAHNFWMNTLSSTINPIYSYKTKGPGKGLSLVNLYKSKQYYGDL